MKREFFVGRDLLAKELKILIVEDSEDDALLVLREIKNADYKADYELVDSPEEFSAALQRQWDVIICDFVMPQFTASDAFKILQKSGKDIPFIIVSGLIGEDIAVEAMKGGVQDYIMKNNLARLVPALERELREAGLRKERVLAMEVSQRRGRQLEILSRASQKINAVLDTPVIMRTLVESGIELVDASGGSAGLCAGDKIILSEFFQDNKWRKFSYEFKKGQGACGEVLATLEPYLTNDAANDEQIPAELKDKWQLRNLVDVPVLGRDGKLWGCFELHNSHNSGFDELDVEMLSGLAASAAVALENGKDIAERKKAEESLQYRFDLEKVITTISTSFIDLPLVQIDRGIFDALHIIGDFAGIDRSYVFQFEKAGTTASNTHEWCAESMKSFKDTLQNIPVQKFSWIFGRIKRGQVVHIPNVEKLGDEAAAEKEEFIKESIKSVVCIPMVCGGVVMGFIGFDSVRQYRSWPNDIILLLRIVGEIFANAIDRKHTEENLRQSEQKFRALVETSSDWIWQIDAGGIYVYCSPKVKELLGYETAEVVGKSIYDFVVEAELGNFKKEFAKYISSQKAFSGIEVVCERKGGGEVVLGKSAVPVYDDYGNFVGYRGIDRDITERKIAEKQLRQSGEFLQTVINADPEATIVVDRDFEIILANQAAKELAGIDPVAAHLTCHKLFHGRDEPCRKKDEQCPVETVLETKRTAKVIHTHRNPADEEVILEISAAPIFDENGEVIQIVESCRDITERQRMLGAIQESEKQYRELVETMNEGICATDGDFVITYVNKRFADMLGYAAEEMVGKAVMDILDEENRAVLAAQIQKRKEGIAGPYDIAFTAKGGGRVYTIVSPKVLLDENGQFISSFGVITDISKRKLAQMELEEERNLLRTLIDTLPDYVYVKDTDSRFAAANKAVAHLMGVPRPEGLIGNTDFDFYPDVMAKEYYEDEQRVMKTGEPLVNKEEATVDIEGRTRFFLTTKVPLKDAAGNIVGIVGAGHDITELREVQQNLSASERRYALAQKAANIGSWEWEIASNIVTWSEQMEPMFGFLPGEFGGTYEAFMDCVHPDDREAIQDSVDANLKEGGEYRIEHRIIWPDGTVKWMSERGATFRDEAGEPIRMLGICQDITERKEAEELRSKLYAELMEKNRELESIIYVASHDLRSPVVNIQGFASELAMIYSKIKPKLEELGVIEKLDKELTAAVEEDVPEAIEYILAGARNLDTLINGLLRLSRLGRAEIEIVDVDMNELIKDVIISKEYQIQTAGADVGVSQLAGCRGDAAQLYQVFSNLLDNALKYIDKGREPVIRIYAEEKPDSVVYCVEDNGKGIAAEHQQKIFEVFHRLEPQFGGGEGLGLTIVRRIMDRHNGNVWVESEAGAGSKFFVEIPK